MKRIISVLSAAALLVASGGTEVPRALAQVIEAASAPTGLGPTGIVSAGVLSSKTPTSPFDGLFSFNTPGFLVLQSISAQLERVAPASAAAASALGPSPEATIHALDRLLLSPQVSENPTSPEAVSAQTIYRALENPRKIAALAVGLSTIHPQIGSALTTGLQDAAKRFYAGGGTRTMLHRLEAQISRLDASRLRDDSGGETQSELDRIFLDPFRERKRADPRAAAPVDARTPALALAPTGLARLQPAPRRAGPVGVTYNALIESLSGPVELPVERLGAADVDDAIALLRQRALNSGRESLLLRQLAELNPDLPIDEPATFLIARDRQPELLKLLKVPEEEPGALRRLSDARRSVRVLIVALPLSESSPAELAAAVLHAAVSVADLGSAGEARLGAAERLLLRGYSQRRALKRLIPAQGVLALGALPADYDTSAADVADSALASVGEAPLSRLAEAGDDSVLHEALGARWDYLRVMVQAAADAPRSARKPALIQQLNTILHRPAYAPSDMERALESVFPDDAEVRTHAAIAAYSISAAPPHVARADRWSHAFRPDFPSERASAVSWRHAFDTVLAFLSLYNGLRLAYAWHANGVVSSFVFPTSMTLGALSVGLLIHSPVAAVGEEAVFRAGLNEWMERGLVSARVSPQNAALYATAVGSAVFAFAHVPAQGVDPVNLGMKWLFGMAASHLYKKHGFSTAVAAHYAWDASVAATAAFPLLVPILALLPAARTLPGLLAQGRQPASPTAAR